MTLTYSIETVRVSIYAHTLQVAIEAQGYASHCNALYVFVTKRFNGYSTLTICERLQGLTGSPVGTNL